MDKKFKFLLIVVVVIAIGLMIVLLINKEPRATGPDTSCTTDDDCWCSSFTGTRFIKGKGPSICCTEKQVQNNERVCKEIGKCSQCFYE